MLFLTRHSPSAPTTWSQRLETASVPAWVRSALTSCPFLSDRGDVSGPVKDSGLSRVLDTLQVDLMVSAFLSGRPKLPLVPLSPPRLPPPLCPVLPCSVPALPPGFERATPQHTLHTAALSSPVHSLPPTILSPSKCPSHTVPGPASPSWVPLNHCPPVIDHLYHSSASSWLLPGPPVTQS